MANHFFNDKAFYVKVKTMKYHDMYFRISRPDLYAPKIQISID